MTTNRKGSVSLQEYPGVFFRDLSFLPSFFCICGWGYGLSLQNKDYAFRLVGDDCMVGFSGHCGIMVHYRLVRRVCVCMCVCVNMGTKQAWGLGGVKTLISVVV